MNEVLHSAPGVGPITSAILIGRLPELATATPRALATLVGVAPLNHDGGDPSRAHTHRNYLPTTPHPGSTE